MDGIDTLLEWPKRVERVTKDFRDFDTVLEATLNSVEDIHAIQVHAEIVYLGEDQYLG
jgi:hypothetical protein